MARKISAVNRRKNIVHGQSEREMAALIQKEMKIAVNPGHLRDFIRSRFVILSILAHEIHAQEPT